jgi:CspA family cold shock protein
MNGKVKRTVVDRGFGFITGEDKTEYFFHFSAVRAGDFKLMKPGDSVTFEPSQGQKGPRAENIRLL